MYSIHNEGKFVVAERFIKTFKNKIYKYMTSVSKNVYIDTLDDIVNKYNITYHSTIKVKPVVVKSNTYIDPSKGINNKDPIFKIGDIVTISKYENILVKGYTPNWSAEVFVIKLKIKKLKKLKILCRGNLLLMIATEVKLKELFPEKNFKKTNQKEFNIGKVIKRKGNKLYVKWKG